MEIKVKEYVVTIVGGEAIKTVAQTGNGPQERYYFITRLSEKKKAGQLGNMSNPLPLPVWSHMHGDLFQSLTEALEDEANYTPITQADNTVNKVIKSGTLTGTIIRERVDPYYVYQYDKTTKKWSQRVNAAKQPVISTEIRYFLGEDQLQTEDGLSLGRQQEIDNITNNMKWVQDNSNEVEENS